MASNENNELSVKKGPHIECKNKIALRQLIKSIEPHIEKILGQQHYVSKAVADSVLKTVKSAIYNSISFYGNQMLDGESNLNATFDHEPIDQEKQLYKDTVLAEWDRMLEDTAKMRKHAPHIIRKHVKKICKHDCQNMMELKVVLRPETDHSEDCTSNRTDMADIEHNMLSTTEQLQTIRQDCEVMEQQVASVHAAVNISRKHYHHVISR